MIFRTPAHLLACPSRELPNSPGPRFWQACEVLRILAILSICNCANKRALVKGAYLFQLISVQQHSVSSHWKLWKPKQGTCCILAQIPQGWLGSPSSSVLCDAESGQCSQRCGLILCGRVWNQVLDLMILMVPFQLEIMIPSLYLNCWLYVCCRPAGDPGFYSSGELFTTSPWRQGAHAPQLCVGLIHEHSLTVNSMVTPHAENNSGRSKCFLCWHLTPPRWFFYITPMIHLEVKSLLWVGCSKRLN